MDSVDRFLVDRFLVIERILLAGTEAEDDSDYIREAQGLRDCLPVAKLANIPAGDGNICWFLKYVKSAEDQFQIKSKTDAQRRKFKHAIREVETASNRLLHALAYLDEQKGKVHLDMRFISQLQDNPQTRWPEPQWYLYLAAVQSSIEFAAGATNDCKSRVDEPLDDCKSLMEASLADFRIRLGALKEAAEQVSIKRLPKLKQNRTKILMQKILAAVDGCGGALTYNKNDHTGTLADVYEFFRARTPEAWTDLSPSTLQRLKSGR